MEGHRQREQHVSVNMQLDIITLLQQHPQGTASISLLHNLLSTASDKLDYLRVCVCAHASVCPSVWVYMCTHVYLARLLSIES